MALIERKIVSEDLIPFGAVILAVVVAIALARAFTLSRPERGGYRGQLALFSFIVTGLLVILVFLPLEPIISGQILGLVGIVLSAAVALSSTTFLGNLFAGGMLRTVRNFSLGDWIRVGDNFGRVTERGLLHVEIQTQDRDLTTLSNLMLATHPVTVVRRSGTIVSAEVGLGYGVPHARAEDALLRGAREAELTDAFVLVENLGDFVVTYRISGFLADVDELISRRSELRRCVLDSLHRADIEIMSPTFMNVLQREPGQEVIPEITGDGREVQRSPESIAFDKADAVKQIETKRAASAEAHAKITEIHGILKSLDGDRKDAMQGELERLEVEAKGLVDEIAEL